MLISVNLCKILILHQLEFQNATLQANKYSAECFGLLLFAVRNIWLFSWY